MSIRAIYSNYGWIDVINYDIPTVSRAEELSRKKLYHPKLIYILVITRKLFHKNNSLKERKKHPMIQKDEYFIKISLF